MAEDVLKGKWKQMKGEVQRQWGKLSNDEVDTIEGDRTKLEGRLQEKYGYSKQEASREVD
ncbi:MAG: CsbD family protein, partial [Desulfovibrionales bacterium]